MINKGSNVEIKTEQGKTPIELAKENNLDEIVDIIKNLNQDKK